MVAPITGRIALEFPASRQAAVSFLPTMVFLWFLVLSTPLAALMNRIGRKATALIGYAFTVVGLMVPLRCGAKGVRWGGISPLRTAGRGQYGDSGGDQSPAGHHRAGRADDQLPHGGPDLPQHFAPAAGADRHGARGAHRIVAPAAADLCGPHGAGRPLAAGNFGGRTAAQRPRRGHGRLLPAAGKPDGAALHAGRGVFHRGRRGDRIPLGAADRQSRFDTHHHGLLHLPHRRHARRGVGAGAGVGREIPALEHGGGFGALRRAAAGARRNGGLRRRGADGIRHGLRFRDVLRRGDQGRARKGQRSGGADDSGHLGGSRFGTRLRGHCPLERRLRPGGGGRGRRHPQRGRGRRRPPAPAPLAGVHPCGHHQRLCQKPEPSPGQPHRPGGHRRHRGALHP